MTPAPVTTRFHIHNSDGCLIAVAHSEEEAATEAARHPASSISEVVRCGSQWLELWRPELVNRASKGGDSTPITPSTPAGPITWEDISYDYGPYRSVTARVENFNLVVIALPRNPIYWLVSRDDEVLFSETAADVDEAKSECARIYEEMTADLTPQEEGASHES